MQHEIISAAPLLDGSGNIAEPGWARSLLPVYRRSDIKASAMRIKEWDYYIVYDGDWGLALTVADNGYMSLVSATVLDFNRAWEQTTTVMGLFPMGKLRLPETSASGVTRYKDKRVEMEFEAIEGERRISCVFADFLPQKTLRAQMVLSQPQMDSMVIATPFDKPAHFYYNQKINCMPAKGSFTFGETEHTFSPETAFGTLDWGRGVWTYDNTWFWGNGNGVVDGKPLGFNIGYGFGNTSAASENLVIYEGRAHKLTDVRFNIPEDSYTKPWTFTSGDGRFEMDFIPVIDRAAHTNALVIESDQHQVFGRFTGEIVLDDGRILRLKNFLGFAEKVRNRY